ncbi:hypothetical protein QN360_20375, partial [Glaciimonas sp. CA11.2]
MLAYQSGQPISVTPWPLAAPHIQQVRAMRAVGGGELKPLILAISIITPQTTNRDSARKLVRAALRETLGILLDMSPQSVPLISEPGHPIRLALPHQQIGLSITHEAGFSLAAINLYGKIGIDTMRTDSISDWQQVAQDYLGSTIYNRILSKPENQRAIAFAEQWTRYEASLKCLCLGIT